jgi:hypothetical protein
VFVWTSGLTCENTAQWLSSSVMDAQPPRDYRGTEPRSRVSSHHSPEYRRYLKSPEWAERKRQYFARHPRRCAACGTYPSKARIIHLHHASYENLGREPDSDLYPLCVSRGWRRLLGFKGLPRQRARAGRDREVRGLAGGDGSGRRD